MQELVGEEYACVWRGFEDRYQCRRAGPVNA